MSSKRFSFRDMTTGDCQRLVSIYNRITNKERTNQQWCHQWMMNHHSDTKYFTIVENESQTIIGGHGVLAFNLYSAKGSIVVGKTENSIIEPKYRGKIRTLR